MRRILLLLCLFAGQIKSQGVPTASFALSSTMACVGETLSCTDLSTGSPSVRNWTTTGATVTGSGSVIVLTYSAPGVYSVALSVIGSGGTSTNVAMQTVVIHPSPSLQALCTPSMIGQGYTSTLTVSGAASYTWQPMLFGGIAYPATVSNSLQITSNASLGTFVFSVSGTSSLGCIGTSTTSVRVVPIGGLNKQSRLPDYSSTGTLVKDRYQLQFTTPFKSFYQLYDAQLRLVTDGFFEDELTLNLQSYASGFYHLVLVSHAMHESIRIYKIND